MQLSDQLIALIKDVLAIQERDIDKHTKLLGAMPEFDSISVVSLITAVEEEYGIQFEDDEISADMFQSVASFTNAVEDKI